MTQPLNQNKMKQTAMQMAINHYKKLSEQGSNQAYLVAKFLEENFLEVEKQHLYNFYVQGGVDAIMEADRNVEQYYNETFKSE